MRTRFTRFVAIAGFLLLASATLSPALGQKGGSTPPPPGTIYYAVSTGTGGYPTESKMNGDGTGKTALFTWTNTSTPSGSWRPDPSYLLHNGKRWFVNLEWPAGFSFTSESNERIVCPVDWADVDVESLGAPCWVPGDAEISFTGRRLDAYGNVIEVGVYGLTVSYNAFGNPAGFAGPPYLKLLAPSRWLNGVHLLPAFGAIGWRPDGSACAGLGTGEANGQLFVVGSAGWNVIYTVPDGRGFHSNSPAWSVTDQIAFSISVDPLTSALYTIAANGGAAKKLDSATASGGSPTRHKVFRYPSWTPDGAYLAYTLATEYWSYPAPDSTSVVKRVNSGGGGIVTLASIKDKYVRVRGWR